MRLEDDSSLNLRNRSNAVRENEKVKPKFIMQPKRVTNMDLKQGRSNFGTLPEEIQLCPLELRPLMKKSSSSIEAKWSNYDVCGKSEKKMRIPRRPRQNNDGITKTGNCSNKTGDMYRNLLGPTPDESILAGLQTVIDLCGLIDDCKDDADLSPTTDSGSGHVYHRQQEIPYPCTFEARVLATSSRQTNNASTDDANETFLTARDHSSRRAFADCPYVQSPYGIKTFSASSDIVEDLAARQRSYSVSRDNSRKKTRTKNNDDLDDEPYCDVCPQCVKELERSQTYNTKLASTETQNAAYARSISTEKQDAAYTTLVSTEKQDATPNKVSRARKDNSCTCDDVCTKPALKVSKKTGTKSPKVKEEKANVPPKHEKAKKDDKSKKEDKKCSSCMAGGKRKTEKEKPKELIDICTECSPCVSAQATERGDATVRNKDVYSQSECPTTGIEIQLSGSKDILIEQTKPVTHQSTGILIEQTKPIAHQSTGILIEQTKPVTLKSSSMIGEHKSTSSENLRNTSRTKITIVDQKSTSSEDLAQATTTRITRECTATNRTCDKKICPHRKKKSTCSTCCSHKSKKKTVSSAKSEAVDETSSYVINEFNDCNVCDECVKKLGRSGNDFVMVNQTTTGNFQNEPNYECNAVLEKSMQTRDATTNSYDGFKTMAYRSSVPKSISGMQQDSQLIRTQTESDANTKPGSGSRVTIQTSGLRRSSISQKSTATGNDAPEQQGYAPAPSFQNLGKFSSEMQTINKFPSEMQTVNKIPSEAQTIPSETKTPTLESQQSRSGAPLRVSATSRRSSGNQAGSHISIIVEEDVKPSSYPSVRSRRSSILQPRSSESMPQTSSDVETSETSLRPSRSLQEVQKEFDEGSPYKMVNGNEMGSRSALSTKCFPPVEIPPTFSNTSIAASPSRPYLCHCKPKETRNRDPSGNRSSHRAPKSRTSSYIDPVGFDRRRKDFRRSGMQIPSVQPVIGMCTSQGAGGDKLLDVRYAVVKISVFEDYTTYEIMKSSTVKPKKIPDCVEGIFVTKR